MSRGPYRRHTPQFKLQLCTDIRSGTVGRREAQKKYGLSFRPNPMSCGLAISRTLPWLRGAVFAAVTHVTVSMMAMMREMVEQRGGQFRVPEHARPFCET